MTIALANAPVSYGVFELTVGSDRYLAPFDRLLDEVAAAGYAGIDLGPVGYLAGGGRLGDRLAAKGLGLAGGYIEMPFHEPAAVAEAMPTLDALLDEFDAAPSAGMPPARPTLAAGGSEGHRKRPGGSHTDRTIGLDDAHWLDFGEGLRRVVERCRERGYEPTFHHHTATYVEAPWEIERVLELSDVGLCLDTGHLLIGGGDPVTMLGALAGRINQVHLKDVRLELLREIVAAGGAADQIWSREVFCPLGDGDLDLSGVIATLAMIGYTGWAVVEQDVLTNSAERFERAVSDQQRNRRTLAGLGL